MKYIIVDVVNPRHTPQLDKDTTRRGTNAIIMMNRAWNTSYWKREFRSWLYIPPAGRESRSRLCIHRDSHSNTFVNITTGRIFEISECENSIQNSMATPVLPLWKREVRSARDERVSLFPTSWIMSEFQQGKRNCGPLFLNSRKNWGTTNFLVKTLCGPEIENLSLVDPVDNYGKSKENGFSVWPRRPSFCFYG